MTLYEFYKLKHGTLVKDRYLGICEVITKNITNPFFYSTVKIRCCNNKFYTDWVGYKALEIYEDVRLKEKLETDL